MLSYPHHWRRHGKIITRFEADSDFYARFLLLFIKNTLDISIASRGLCYTPPVAPTPTSDVPPIGMSRDSVFVGLQCTSPTETLPGQLYSGLCNQNPDHTKGRRVSSLAASDSCKHYYDVELSLDAKLKPASRERFKAPLRYATTLRRLLSNDTSRPMAAIE